MGVKSARCATATDFGAVGAVDSTEDPSPPLHCSRDNQKQVTSSSWEHGRAKGKQARTRGNRSRKDGFDGLATPRVLRVGNWKLYINLFPGQLEGLHGTMTGGSSTRGRPAMVRGPAAPTGAQKSSRIATVVVVVVVVVMTARVMEIGSRTG